jgi:hypothetical protein
MAPDRRKPLVLALLGGTLALLVGYRLWPATTAGSFTASNGREPARTAQSQPQVTAPDVHIDALSAERPKPDNQERDLFKFKPKPPAPLPPRPAAPPPAPPVGVGRSGPPPPPRVPPITLKFIGYIETSRGEKIASLSDGIGLPMETKEGGTVLGRYKIWRVGVESIDISYLDGSGRTTIRLTGQ